MTENIMERISSKLLDNIEQRLDTGALLEPKDYKAVTGALRELKELQRGDVKKEEGLVVSFLDGTEEMSV